MAKSKLVEVNKKIEKSVVGGYKAIEEGVVGGFTKMSDKFVDQFLTHENETVEEAKERVKKEQKARESKNESRLIKAEQIIGTGVSLEQVQGICTTIFHYM